MAFKFVVLSALLAVANAGLAPVVYSSPVAIANPSVDAVGSTQQNVVRSYAGTVSQYSKAVDTPYSSVRKTDTRINNNVYTPAYAKTLAYAAPAPVVKTLSYAAPAPVYKYAAPQAVYAQPAPVLKYAAPQAVYAQQAPVLKYAAPQAVYAQPAPVVKYAAPAVYSAAPAQAVYAQQASSAYSDPSVSAYSSKAISYSPASAVAHVTFEGLGVHYGY